MPRIASLAILSSDDPTAKDFLSEEYGKVIKNVQKGALSTRMKNQELSGDPTTGTVEAKRFANAEPQAYGTARAAGAGNKVKAKPVTVAIDDDKEFVEEMEEKDTSLYGVDGLVQRRGRNQELRMIAYLDTRFFAVAGEAAVEVEIASGTAIEDILETIIQECENTKNQFVDGVPRSMMNLILSTKYYGYIRNDLDKQKNSNVDTAAEEFYTWHGVKTDSCVNLPSGVDVMLMVDGSVAQPVMPTPYTVEKIPLSKAYGLELFFSNGTKVVTPDLIFVAKFVSDGDDGDDTITLSPLTATVAAGGTTTITAATNPADATVTWASSDTAVATVANGVVTGVAAGIAIITATNGDASAICAVTVTGA